MSQLFRVDTTEEILCKIKKRIRIFTLKSGLQDKKHEMAPNTCILEEGM